MICSKNLGPILDCKVRAYLAYLAYLVPYLAYLVPYLAYLALTWLTWPLPDGRALHLTWPYLALPLNQRTNARSS